MANVASDRKHAISWRVGIRNPPPARCFLVLDACDSAEQDALGKRAVGPRMVEAFRKAQTPQRLWRTHESAGLAQQSPSPKCAQPRQRLGGNGVEAGSPRSRWLGGSTSPCTRVQSHRCEPGPLRCCSQSELLSPQTLPLILSVFNSVVGRLPLLVSFVTCRFPSSF